MPLLHSVKASATHEKSSTHQICTPVRLRPSSLSRRRRNKSFVIIVTKTILDNNPWGEIHQLPRKGLNGLPPLRASCRTRLHRSAHLAWRRLEALRTCERLSGVSRMGLSGDVLRLPQGSAAAARRLGRSSHAGVEERDTAGGPLTSPLPASGGCCRCPWLGETCERSLGQGGHPPR